MGSTIYPKVLFGDNQFLGVNHYSAALASQNFQQFQEKEAILKVLGDAYECGLRHFFFTTHHKYDGVFSEIVSQHMFPEMTYTPCLPYAHKYSELLATQTPQKLFFDALRKIRLKNGIYASVGGILGNFAPSMRAVVDLEMSRYEKINVSGIFLLNILNDLLVGLEAHKEMESFYDYVQNSLQLTPGFFTMNFKKTEDFLTKKLKIHKPWICTNVNTSGFRMFPDSKNVFNDLEDRNSNVIAMSVFAGSDISKTYELFGDDKYCDSVLFGSTKKMNIEKNYQSFNKSDKYLKTMGEMFGES